MIGMNAHYDSVKIFNTISGSLDEVNKSSLALQIDLLQEEFLETVEAFDNKDATEFLDGVADMFVVIAGLIQKLEALGVNVDAAIRKVCVNNLDKFPENTTCQPDNTIVVYNKMYGRVAFLDDVTSKIRKPLDFTSVDLSDVEMGSLIGVLSQDLEEFV